MKKFLNFHRQLFKQNRAWFKVIFIWFGLTFLLGAFAFYFLPGLLDIIVKVFKEKFGAQPDLSLGLAKEIFINNLIASGFALFAGIFLGFGSLLVIGINGFIFGYIVISLFVISPESFIKTTSFILAGILPHGIFELAAFFIAGALGLRLGLEWLGKNAKGTRLKTLGNNLVNSFLFVPPMVLLLIIAALVEVFISSRIVNNF